MIVVPYRGAITVEYRNDEAVDTIYHASFEAVAVQVALWSCPCVGESDWWPPLRPFVDRVRNRNRLNAGRRRCYRAEVA